MNSLEFSQNQIERALKLKIISALKSGRAEKDGYSDVYFMDNQQLLLDNEVMEAVVGVYPYCIGHLTELNKDEDFVRRWFDCIKDSELKKKVYVYARQNSLRITLEELN
jgi:hypothetical protein